MHHEKQLAAFKGNTIISPSFYERQEQHGRGPRPLAQRSNDNSAAFYFGFALGRKFTLDRSMSDHLPRANATGLQSHSYGVASFAKADWLQRLQGLPQVGIFKARDCRCAACHYFTRYNLSFR